MRCVTTSAATRLSWSSGGASESLSGKLARRLEPATTGRKTVVCCSLRPLRTDTERRAIVKVLIAEDEPVSRHLLQSYLQQWGHQVVAAPDGAAAWRLF